MDFSEPEKEVSSDMDYEQNFYGSSIERFHSHSSVSLSDNSNSDQESCEESITSDKIVSTQINYRLLPFTLKYTELHRLHIC